MSNAPFSNPFDNEHTIRVLSTLPSFEEAIARILFLVEYRRPAGILVGRPGTGKSTLLELVHRELSTADCCPVLIDLRNGTPAELPWMLATALGLSPEMTLHPNAIWRAIEDRFHGMANAGVSFVPVFDHLDDADDETLGVIERCGHLVAREGGTLLLAAAPPLTVNLQSIVRSMCDLRIELPLWTPVETALFVTQLLSQSGDHRVTESGIATIHGWTDGLCRDVIQLCRLALFTARSQEIESIDSEFLEIVAGELWRPTTTRPADLPSFLDEVEQSSSPDSPMEEPSHTEQVFAERRLR